MYNYSSDIVESENETVFNYNIVPEKEIVFDDEQFFNVENSIIEKNVITGLTNQVTDFFSGFGTFGNIISSGLNLPLNLFGSLIYPVDTAKNLFSNLTTIFSNPTEAIQKPFETAENLINPFTKESGTNLINYSEDFYNFLKSNNLIGSPESLQVTKVFDNIQGILNNENFNTVSGNNISNDVYKTNDLTIPYNINDSNQLSLNKSDLNINDLFTKLLKKFYPENSSNETKIIEIESEKVIENQDYYFVFFVIIIIMLFLFKVIKI